MDKKLLGISKSDDKSIASGFDHAVRTGDNTFSIFFIDGSQVDLTIPLPEDGLSITDIKVDANNHIICIMSDKSTIDAGELPKTQVEVSKESGNAITEKADGLYVAAGAVEISKETGNIISAKADGLYAKADTIEISKEADNIIEKKTDGLYAKADEVKKSTKTDNILEIETDGSLYVPKADAQIQADFNQTDNTKADFIKNKPVVDATYSATSDNAQSGKAVASAISTELGKLTYLTKVIATKAEIESYIADPTKASFNVIYLLKDTSTKGADKYYEYQRIGDDTTSTFEMTGDTSTDLSDLVSKDEGNRAVMHDDGVYVTNQTGTVGDWKVKGGGVVVDITDSEGDVSKAEFRTVPGEAQIIVSGANSMGVYSDYIDLNGDTKVTGDLKLEGDILKGTNRIIEIGDKGHIYHKTGVDIGTADVPKPLNVHGTLNVDRHSIYCEGIKASDSIFCESYVKTENLMSASSTYLGNAKSSSDISFFCQNVRVVADKGKEAMQMDSPLALMSVQPIYVDGKYVNQAHLDMGYGGHGHISTERLDVKRLQSNSNGGIDVGTPMRFHSHIDCGEINMAGGFALTIKDEASHQNMKLTSDGSIFCGDIHCNYPIQSPSGEGTKHSGNAYGEHSIDGVGYFTARNISTYESITYYRTSQPPIHFGLQRKIATLTPSSTTASASIITCRILQFALIKNGNTIEDIKEVYTELEEHNGASVLLRTASDTTHVLAGFNLAQGRLMTSGTIPTGYVIRVLGID